MAYTQNDTKTGRTPCHNRHLEEKKLVLIDSVFWRLVYEYMY